VTIYKIVFLIADTYKFQVMNPMEKAIAEGGDFSIF